MHKDQLFRGFAEDLGLDLAAYDAAVADLATLERVVGDRDDGLALGVEATRPHSSTERKSSQPPSTISGPASTLLS